jgi:hypothetical protein
MHTQVQLDPLNSPHPLPWNWVSALVFGNASASTRAPASSASNRHYYRSQSLISPDGQYAAYSRTQVLTATPNAHSQVASVLFVENLRTGSLKTIMPSSPFADNPFAVSEATDLAGTIAMLMPIGWSESGDRLLAREFESMFCSDIASDFAVILDSATNQTQTLAPRNIAYSNAILLGWSQTHPDQVLFQAGMMGDFDWNIYAVSPNGHTVIANDDRPVVHGNIMTHVWAGPQTPA